MSVEIKVPQRRIADFCQRWGIKELSIFGSALRDDFRPDSDVDVLVAFEPGVHRSFQEWLDMTEQLEAMFGRHVDLVERRSVEQSENYIRRRHILNHLEQVYVA